ncbi:RDD family protein [Ferruginibacter albus]|uniref:RDD family protein n=1 Tax=Ferruginibacter albus TaxID=2875540 RepID=UPI001CC6BC7C|nr:RDD family protein [Ferruginibacter albus]UAY53409.1 RDD family protein [Ferruginibacter albus]
MKPTFPMLIDRVQSMVIDFIIIVVLMYGLSQVLGKLDNVSPQWIHIVLFFTIWFLYEPFFVWLGCTPGQYVKKLRVRKETDINHHINFIQSLMRYVIKMLLGWVSFFTIDQNQEKRAIHDFVSESVMIKL